MLSTRKKNAQLTPTAAAAKAAAGEVTLVDVREPHEREQARPAGSQHMPLGELPTRLEELPRGRTVAFICRSGGRSAVATSAASAAGLSAANVRGGLIAWADAGLAVESGAEPTTPKRKASS